MPICRKCGVELEAEAVVCPLCGTETNGSIVEREQIERITPTADPKRKRLWFLELFSFFAAAGFIIVFAVDFAYGAALYWSRIPLISILFAWLFVFLIHHLIRKPYMLVSLEMINFFIFLWFLDKFIPAYSWFFSLALPIILVIGFLFLIVILWIRSFNLTTFTAIAVGTLAVGVFLVCLEVILSLFHWNTILISWSLVAFACILPVSGLFLYLQKKLNKERNEMKKFFHL